MPFDEKEWHHCITFIWNAMLSFLQCLKLSLKRIEVKSKVEKLFIVLHLHMLLSEKHDSVLVKLWCNESPHDWKMQFQVALPGLSGGLQMWWAFRLNCCRSLLYYRGFKQKIFWSFSFVLLGSNFLMMESCHFNVWCVC